MVRLLCVLIVGGLLFGCATGNYGGNREYTEESVGRPALSNTDIGAWRAYYRDQFRVHGSRVPEPGAGYSNAAKEAYRLELIGWSSGDELVQTPFGPISHSTLVWTGIAFAGILLVFITN
jgi:hypothetical protein